MIRDIYSAALHVLPERDIAHDYISTDLYLRVTPESTELINDYEFKSNVKTFIDAIDHELFYDVPFAYTPNWDRLLRGEA